MNLAQMKKLQKKVEKEIEPIIKKRDETETLQRKQAADDEARVKKALSIRLGKIKSVLRELCEKHPDTPSICVDIDYKRVYSYNKKKDLAIRIPVDYNGGNDPFFNDFNMTKSTLEGRFYLMKSEAKKDITEKFDYMKENFAHILMAAKVKCGTDHSLNHILRLGKIFEDFLKKFPNSSTGEFRQIYKLLEEDFYKDLDDEVESVSQENEAKLLPIDESVSV